MWCMMKCKCLTVHAYLHLIVQCQHCEHEPGSANFLTVRNLMLVVFHIRSGPALINFIRVDRRNYGR